MIQRQSVCRFDLVASSKSVRVVSSKSWQLTVKLSGALHFIHN
jgi:hypothetical protein